MQMSAARLQDETCTGVCFLQVIADVPLWNRRRATSFRTGPSGQSQELVC